MLFVWMFIGGIILTLTSVATTATGDDVNHTVINKWMARIAIGLLTIGFVGMNLIGPPNAPSPTPPAQGKEQK